MLAPSVWVCFLGLLLSLGADARRSLQPIGIDFSPELLYITQYLRRQYNKRNSLNCVAQKTSRLYHAHWLSAADVRRGCRTVTFLFNEIE
ncbi:hypothetical protein BDV29DRAFT_165914 [Aspergillus leporis]|uniref:Uncharacterized protein n=1 Tax=Aspergillus leporis TaxID=41062 RepID=A0A5N5XCX6_9EURO|nr:hypothetical protein BDV29DRAFT_165914 [Aspergillus leporis]